jgi:hypothetical protein
MSRARVTTETCIAKYCAIPQMGSEATFQSMAPSVSACKPGSERCCTAGAARRGLHGGCCTAGAARQVLHDRCCTADAARQVLHDRCCTAGATRQVLHDRCCTTGAARQVLHGRCSRQVLHGGCCTAGSARQVLFDERRHLALIHARHLAIRCKLHVRDQRPAVVQWLSATSYLTSAVRAAGEGGEHGTRSPRRREEHEESPECSCNFVASVPPC